MDVHIFQSLVIMKTLALLRFGCAALLGAACSGLLAQPAPAGKMDKPYVPYRITRGDYVTVQVLGEPDLIAGRKRVEATGSINLALIQDVRLVGLTIAEAQASIAKAYRDGLFLRNPQVTVTVDEFAPRTVYVSGKVNIQGRQEIPADMQVTIKDVISKAGGFGDTAKGTQVKLTRTMPDGQVKIHILDVESGLKGRSTSGDANFVVEPDDTIYVPEKII